MPATPFRPGKAKSVIQIWQWGGPSQLDTFDPKPEAGNDYCGQFKTPIETNVKGIRISEMLPLLAKQADKYSLIRSMTHGDQRATKRPPTSCRPAGSRAAAWCVPRQVRWCRCFKGYGAGYKGLVPPYIVLTELQGRFSEVGFLPSSCKPFATGGDPQQARFVVEGVVAQGDHRPAPGGSAETARRSGHAGQGAARRCPACRGARGAESGLRPDPGRCGQGVRPVAGKGRPARHVRADQLRPVLPGGARRLVERGVPYVTINFNGWDTHKQHFQAMRRLRRRSGQGLVDAAAGSGGPRSARKHHRLVLRRIRPHAQDPLGAALERRTRALRQRASPHWWPAAVSRAATSSARPTPRASRSRIVPCIPCDLLGSMYELLGIDPAGHPPPSAGQDRACRADRGRRA